LKYGTPEKCIELGCREDIKRRGKKSEETEPSTSQLYLIFRI